MEIAKEAGLTIQTTPIAPEVFATMDGAFLTNAVQGIQLIDRIDDHVFLWPQAAQNHLSALQNALAKASVIPVPAFTGITTGL
jgi:branched-subunit amino acid aminotransferase/4-amino-4-deoxychorismate lyase